MIDGLMTVAEYAKEHNLSKAKVYKLMSGELAGRVETRNGIKYIRIEEIQREEEPAREEPPQPVFVEEQQPTAQQTHNPEEGKEPPAIGTETALKRIADLEAELVKAREETAQERRRNAELTQEIISLTREVLELTKNAQILTGQAQKQQQQILLLEDGKREKPWYQRIFGRKKNGKGLEL